MNKQRRGQLLSLMLAILVLASVAPGFFVPVSAQPTTMTITYVNTNYNENTTLFAGFNYTIEMNVTYDDTINSNIYAEIYYRNSTYEELAYRTPDPGFSVVNGEASFTISPDQPGWVSNESKKVPQWATEVIVVITDPVYGLTATWTFDVKFPYDIAYTLTSTVPYYNGAWLSDKAFKEIPFNLTVTVTYNDTLVSGLGIALPSSVNATVKLPDGNSVIMSIPIDPVTGTGSETFVNLVSAIPGSSTITVEDTTNNLVQTISGPEIYDWNINFQTVLFEYGTTVLTQPCECIPFNITGTVYAYTTLGGLGAYTLGINDTVNLVLLNNTIYNATANMVNGTASFSILNVTLSAGIDYALRANLTLYTLETTYYFDVSSWGITGDYIVYHYNALWNADKKFYVGVPASLYLNVIYGACVNLTSTANVTIELPNGTVYHYTIPVTDNYGEISIPDFQVNDPGNVTVTIFDPNYCMKGTTFTIPVQDWGIYVDNFPEYLIRGVQTDLTVEVMESLYFDWPGDRDVNVTIELPDGYTETKTLTLEGNDDIFSGQGGYQGVITFLGLNSTVAGYAKLTVTDVLSGKTVVKYIPVKEWAIEASVEPQLMYVNVTDSVTVNIKYINKLDGNAEVMLILPNGSSDAVTVPIAPEANGNGYGQAIFNDVVSEIPGNITVIVRDVDTGESAEAIIEVRDWHIEVIPTIEKFYLDIPVNYTVNITYVDETGAIALINASNVSVGTQFPTRSIGAGHDVINGQVIVPFINIVPNETGIAYVYAIDSEHGKSGRSNDIPIYNWSIHLISYPKVLYKADHYTNNVVIEFEYLGDDNETVPITDEANVTLELPDGETPLSKLGFGSVEFSDVKPTAIGNATLTISLPRYGREVSVQISVKDLLQVDVEPNTIYDSVPTEIRVTVTHGVDEKALKNVTVTINGVQAKSVDTDVWALNVTLPAGEYNVTVYDSSYNETVIKTITVLPWELSIEVTPNTIKSGGPQWINFYVTATAPINGTVMIDINFSNDTVVPDDYFDFEIEMVNGAGSAFRPIFAPISGEFTITATIYSHTNLTTITVEKPGVNEVAWVYANIRIENTTDVPNEDTVIYIRYLEYYQAYLPVYDPITEKPVIVPAGQDEVAFRVYPGEGWWGYLIAVPKTVFDKQKISIDSINGIEWPETKLLKPEVSINVTSIGYYAWNISVIAEQYLKNTTYYFKPSMYPGWIYIEPGTSSVQANAIYTNLTSSTKTTLYDIASNYTTIIIHPDNLTLSLLDETDKKLIVEGQEGPEFTIQALLRIMNVSEQFKEQFASFENWVMSIDFLNETEKQGIVDEIMAEVGILPEEPVPVPDATIEFYHTNPAIADLIPETAITDENGIATITVKSKATSDMLPEELANLVGSTTVSAAYGALPSNNTITVTFLGTGSVSGDITDLTGMQISGAKVYLKIKVNGEWVNATDYYGNQLITQSAEDGHYSISDIPVYASEGTEYLVVAEFDGMRGFAYVTVRPFTTATADVKLSGEAQYTGIAMYKEKVETADTVYLVFNNFGTPDAFSVSQYVSRTIPITTRTISVFASEFNISTTTGDDVVISVGGPLVNPVTAVYEDIAPVHMDISSFPNITIITPEGNVTWTAPTPWWNVTEGYFIIQLFTDANTGALVVTIYGTDADSTMAGAYYFLTEIYPNIINYNGITYIVGKWTDTEPGADYPLPGDDLGDTSGFSAGDTIEIVFMG